VNADDAAQLAAGRIEKQRNRGGRVDVVDPLTIFEFNDVGKIRQSASSYNGRAVHAMQEAIAHLQSVTAMRRKHKEILGEQVRLMLAYMGED